MKINFKTLISWIIIAGVAYLVINNKIPTNGAFLNGGDGRYHAAIIAGYQQSFLNHDFFPKGVLPLVGFNLGYGNQIFYSTFFHYITALISLLINNEQSVYIAMIIMYYFAIFLSGIMVYMLSKKIFKKPLVALCSALIYMYLPYHTTQIYTLDWVGSIWIFVFLPLAIMAIFYLIENKKALFVINFTIAIIGMMFANLMTSVFMCIFIFFFMLCYFQKIFNKNNIKTLLLTTILILGFSAPYWLNLLYFKCFTDYRVFLPDVMASYDTIKATSMPFTRFNTLDNTGLERKVNVALLPFIWLLIAISLCCLNKYQKHQKYFIYLSCGIIIISLYLVSDLSPIIDLKPLYIIQFTHRLMTIPCLFISLLAPLCLGIINNNIIKFLIFIFLIFNVIKIGENNIKLETKNYQDDMMYAYGPDIIYYPPVHDLQNLKKTLGDQYEYMPSNYQCDDFYKRRSENIKFLQGSGEAIIYQDVVPNMDFKLENTNVNTIVELPRVYYPGYEIIHDGKKDVSLSLSNNGFLQLTGAHLDGNYHLVYKGTKALLSGFIIMILTTFYSIYLLIKYFLLKRKD